MTDQEIIEAAVAATIASLKTNGKTVAQLTPVNSYSSSDYVELSGGRRIALTAIQAAVEAAMATELNAMASDITGMGITVFSSERTASTIVVQIKQAGHSAMTITLPTATSEYAGVMSAEDKEKLDAISDASVVEVVDLADIDDLKTADCQLATTPTRYAVKKTTSRGTVVVALLDILSDDMRHVVTQVITTHYVIENGVIDTSVHRDGELFRYYRSCKVSGGTLPVDAGEWTPWQYLVPRTKVLSQESYDAMVDSGTVEEDVFYFTEE